MPSIAGEYAITLAFIALLKSHLQAAIDANIADLGLGLTINAPDADKGYSDSRLLPRNTSPSARVYHLGTERIDEIQLYDAPIRERPAFRVVLRYGGPSIQDTGRRLTLVARAAKRVIEQHWRGTFATTRLQRVEVKIDSAGATLIGEDRIEALTTRGRPQQSSQSEIALIAECVQSVYAPISLTA